MVPLKIASNFTCPKKQRKRLNPVTLCYLIGLGSLKLEHTVLDIDLLKKMGLYCLLPLVVEFFFNVYWIYQRSSYITYTVLVVWRHERRENLPDNASFSQLYGLYMHIWSYFFCDNCSFMHPFSTVLCQIGYECFFFKRSLNFIHVPNEFGRRMYLVRPFCLSG